MKWHEKITKCHIKESDGKVFLFLKSGLLVVHSTNEKCVSSAAERFE